MEERLFKTFRTTGSDEIRFGVHFGPRGFSLTIFNKDSAFTAKILEEDLEKQADRLKSNLVDYKEKLIDCFKTNSEAVELRIKKNDFVILVDSKVRFFECKLTKGNYEELANSVFDDLSSENNALRLSLENTSKLLEEAQNDKNMYKTKLEELVERKRLETEQMCSDFVLLLNEKKRHIQHLTETLQAFQSNPTQKKFEKKEEVSESEPSTTDEEVINEDEPMQDLFLKDNSPPCTLPPKRLKSEPNFNNNLAQPSTSKQSTNQSESKASNSKSNNDELNFNTQELFD